MQGHKQDETKLRTYKGWYLYQCGAYDNMWSCAKHGWTTEEYDEHTAWMPVEYTQQAIKQWINENGHRSHFDD